MEYGIRLFIVRKVLTEVHVQGQMSGPFTVLTWFSVAHFGHRQLKLRINHESKAVWLEQNFNSVTI